MNKKAKVLICKEHHSTASGLQKAKTDKLIERVVKQDNEGLYISWRNLRYPVQAWHNGYYITTGAGVGY